MDEFYTANPTILLPYINKYITDKDILIEPSCGDGSFLKILKFDRCFDIVKKVEEIGFECKDFLNVEDIEPGCCFIGNPPFGKNSKLAIKFCQHCCNLNAKYIMFILSIVFKQEKYKNISFDKYYQLMEEIKYNDFINNGKKVIVNCVFQIWKRNKNKHNIQHQQINIPTNKYFKYITKSRLNNNYKPNEYTFSIRRVGSKTPELSKGVHNSLEDHFIIELNKEYDINDFVNKYNEYNFELSPSTKQKHITKTKLNEQVNKLCVSKINETNKLIECMYKQEK